MHRLETYWICIFVAREKHVLKRESLKKRRAFVTCSTKYASLHCVSLLPYSACSLALCQSCSACNTFANRIRDDSSVHCVSPKQTQQCEGCHNGKCQKTEDMCLYQNS